MIDGKIVGYAKAVNQVVYSEIINAGHHLLHDQPDIMRSLFANWVDYLKEDEAEPTTIVAE